MPFSVVVFQQAICNLNLSTLATFKKPQNKQPNKKEKERTHILFQQDISDSATNKKSRKLGQHLDRQKITYICWSLLASCNFVRKPEREKISYGNRFKLYQHLKIAFLMLTAVFVVHVYTRASA